MTAPVSNQLSLSTSSAERPARFLPVTIGEHTVSDLESMRNPTMTMTWEECAEAGMTPRQAAKHRKADPAEVARLADEGYSQAVVAEMLGVSRERIRQIADRDGIDFLPGNADYDTREKVAELHGRGLTDTEIAAEIGRDRQTAINFRRVLGLPVNKPPKRSKYEAAIREMAARGMTVGEVAVALGIPGPHVSMLKAKFNIPFIADGRAKRFAPC